MEIEQQKREWEEKRLIQKQNEQLAKHRMEMEENETLTYSREDSLNKVNIRSKTKSQTVCKRKFENVKNSGRGNEKGKKSNGTESCKQNGMQIDTERKLIATASNNVDNSARRHTRNLSNRSKLNDSIKIKTRTQLSVPNVGQREIVKKYDRSVSMNSLKSHARSISESTSRSLADSTSQPTSTMTASPDESDSECSLDVMIDSNDVNDSDSNSNQNTGHDKERIDFDSVSINEETVQNDNTVTEEAIGKLSDSLKGSEEDNKLTSSPRTRSRGTVKINLWTLDESPIMAPKRQKLTNFKNSSDTLSKDDKQLKADFGVKECCISLTKPSSKPKSQKRILPTKSNRSLESWAQNSSDVSINRTCDFKATRDDTPERVPITRQRRNTILTNNSL